MMPALPVRRSPIRAVRRVVTALLLGLLAVAARPAPAQEGAADAFDGERALAHAAAMVDMGPRPLGSEALERNRVYIEEQLRAVGLDPRRDAFTADTPIGPVPMANILADIAAADGRAGSVLLLAGHYDTKLFEGVRFLGANDGASSAAILLELARVLAERPIAVPVRLVFFDGEEAVVRWTDEDSTYGSRHMVARLQGEDRIEEIGALVLLDMIGDADLQVLREHNSTPWLMDILWEAAARRGHGEAFSSASQAILDDHLPFLDAGVPAVDLIDFTYGPGNRYWHSPMDTLDKLSADSFQVVGETVLEALPEIAERLIGG